MVYLGFRFMVFTLESLITVGHNNVLEPTQGHVLIVIVGCINFQPALNF